MPTSLKRCLARQTLAGRQQRSRSRCLDGFENVCTTRVSGSSANGSKALKERHEKGLLTSVEFLKELLNLARDVVSAERAAPSIEPEEQGKAALTQLSKRREILTLRSLSNAFVNDIDEIVRIVRFDGWQSTHAGEREVKLALRKTLFKYRLHQDQELFERAYGYIREYY